MLRPSSAGYTKDDLCGGRPRAAQKRPTRGPACTCCEKSLLGNDDLAVLVVTAVGAHVVRELGGAALRAHGARRSGELAVGRTTGVGGAAALLLLGYCHVKPLLSRRRPPLAHGGAHYQFTQGDTIARVHEKGTCSAILHSAGASFPSAAPRSSPASAEKGDASRRSASRWASSWAA